MFGRGSYSGLFLKENGEWKHFFWDRQAALLLLSCALPLRSDRSRRHIPREWVQQAHEGSPSRLRDSAAGSYSPFFPHPSDVDGTKF